VEESMTLTGSDRRPRIACVSTYLPRRCGIATFAHDLCDAICKEADDPEMCHIVAMNEPVPDLLQHEAQALVEGSAEDGTFNANPGGLFLKCPTRYEELEPETVG